ncbi:hypothetical protein THF5H11_20048 [Vibrio jasicida]|nr:hypothetical protein THF5H11_20048 [Vibrio jasicida]CAH1608327.1 hypothetical protein THF5G08_60047 [Vibrio jasicida]
MARTVFLAAQTISTHIVLTHSRKKKYLTKGSDLLFIRKMEQLIPN